MEQEAVYRSRRDVQPASKVAFQEFVQGLQTMSADFDRHVQNFAWCAGQIAGDPNSSAQLVGMMEFALQLHELGLETAIQAVEVNSGLPVSIVILEVEQPEKEGLLIVKQGSKRKPGIIVGITGVSYVNRDKVFDGIAVMQNSRGQESFIAVGIRPNGETFLRPDLSQPQYPETARLMKELYPQVKGK